MKYKLSNNKNEVIANSLDAVCNECFLIARSSSSSVKHKCPVQRVLCRIGFAESVGKSVFLCSSAKDDLNSTKSFNAKSNAFLVVVNHLEDTYNTINETLNKRTRRLIHNLISINAHSMQEIYDFVPQEVMSKNINHQLRDIQNAIKGQLSSASKLFLRMAKNNLKMKTEFSVFKNIHDTNKSPVFGRHEVRKVVLNVLHTFFTDFTDNNVVINVQDCSLSTTFDYETLSVAIFDIADNATKYIMPDSSFDVYFENIDGELNIVFEMFSFPIKPEEVDRLCEEGFSGELCSKLGSAGDGIGMFRTKRLLELNKAVISVESNINPRVATSKAGFEYELNRFRITLSTCKQRKAIKS